MDQSLQIEESLLKVKEDGSIAVVIVNNSNSSCQLKKSLKLGQATGAATVDHTTQESLLIPQSPATAANLSVECQVMQQSPEVLNVVGVTTSTCTSSECVKWRQQQLGKIFERHQRSVVRGRPLTLGKVYVRIP